MGMLRAVIHPRANGFPIDEFNRRAMVRIESAERSTPTIAIPGRGDRCQVAPLPAEPASTTAPTHL